MAKSLNDQDRRAIDLLLDSAARSSTGRGNGNGNGGGKGNCKGGKGNAAKGPPSSRPDMTVQHRNGIREGISKGRYTMRDSRGRVIVSRPATPLDYLRALGRP